jgi:hypothetical protein
MTLALEQLANTLLACSPRHGSLLTDIDARHPAPLRSIGHPLYRALIYALYHLKDTYGIR